MCYRMFIFLLRLLEEISEDLALTIRRTDYLDLRLNLLGVGLCMLADKV